MPKKTKKHLRKSGKYIYKRMNASKKKIGGIFSRSSKVLPKNAYLAKEQEDKKVLKQFYNASKERNIENSKKYPGRKMLETHFDVE